jgi:hypothetical protein
MYYLLITINTGQTAEQYILSGTIDLIYCYFRVDMSELMSFVVLFMLLLFRFIDVFLDFSYGIHALSFSFSLTKNFKLFGFQSVDV